ncbi:MAG: neutral/alkaline non-lysosomal ceramidase N-terminal domain-containing protein, partial [Actinomycetota bacterium]|nr:neutral/alkaline non-lysosomal ceramidase N-terminal domain-containing protein [Actinomycetota bacterium]
MFRGVVLGALAALVLAAPAAAEIRAGVGVADATWHVGAAAGQYASERWEGEGELDPHLHQFRRSPSYGIHSRLQMRAVVVEGMKNPAPGAASGSNRFALVKTDLYIPQDLLYRRAAQLIPQIAGRDIGIDRTNLVMSATHDHSSPFYTSTAWGTWTFQDVFDVRAYEYYARAIAEAVVEATEHMKPVKVGASTTYLDAVHRNSMGPKKADDGTPAGYPWDYTDHALHVVRIDERGGKPLATIVNYSNHPEGLDGNDLISADWVAALERMVDRATGGTTIYTQNAVGHSEMERSSHRDVHERHEYYHREYAQGERAARVTADAALAAWRAVGAGKPNDPRYADNFVPFFDDAVVDFHDAWFPGPLTHPYPAVSSCRTDAIAANPPDPRVPGPPECFEDPGFFSAFPWSDMPIPENSPGLVYDELKKAGIPVPENLGLPSYTGLEEDISVHLQGFRIGEIFFPVCSCEQWADQSLNLKARTDKVAGNETQGDNLGYDWSDECTAVGDGSTYSCPNADPDDPVTKHEYERMRAQVRNDAHGWNSTTYAPYAEAEPYEPSEIKGNFTHDDNATSAQLGYRLTVPISMANDYNGYIVSYREFQEGDHYRKSLAGWGPHSSDYMTTRLVKLGRLMKGGPDLIESVRHPDGRDAGPEGVVDPDADNVALQAKADADADQQDAR